MSDKFPQQESLFETDAQEQIMTMIEAQVETLARLRKSNAPLREQVQACTILKDLLFKYGSTFYPTTTSGRERILAYLKDNLGQVVDSDELSIVSGIQEHARRIRELRREQGWVISSHLLGRPDLKADQYVLETLEQTDATERTIPDEVAKKVFTRDENRCVICHWSPSAWTRENARYLELHHRRSALEGGPPTVENLETRCNICHKRAHTK